jgi:acetolactate synthase-1/2/3 large subunit
MLEQLDLEQVSADVLGELIRAKKPLLVFGWGVRLAGAHEEAAEVAACLDIPVATTWGAADMFPDAIGSFGTHGIRPANFAIQSADYILCVGARLDTKAMGAPPSSFAPNAKLVMVDIDAAELDKMGKVGRLPHRAIRADARNFLRMLLCWSREYEQHNTTNDDDSGYVSPWRLQIKEWKERYPAVLPAYRQDALINPYVFIDQLSDAVRTDDVIVSDTGCCLAWIMQAFKFRGQRFIHQFNQTPMGCGLSVNITEMATVERHNLPVKIILFNNRGHAMCRQTQRQWLGGEYPATSVDGGLAAPNFLSIASAYGFRAFKTKWADSALISLEQCLEDDLPGFLELETDINHGVVPQARFGAPLEDQEPVLPREELEEIMRRAA